MLELHRPQTTVRWRLTLLYGGLFLVCGAGLLAITYVLVAHASITPSVRISHLPGHASVAPVRAVLPSRSAHDVVYEFGVRQRISDLHDLVIESAIALGIMAVMSGVLGWVVAGRVLAPLRTITATARQISETNLHQRLAIAGPRDELRELADTIDGLLERLETAFEAQRRFVANASHELRTPLSAMRVALDVALAKPQGVPAQLTALDATLRADLDQADRLLESFLVLARAQHGQLGAHTTVSLAQTATEALIAQGDQIDAQQIEVHAALTPVQVSGSETLLARMVENLIENAVRHNQPHGFINIECDADAGRARLMVESSGPILNQDAVEKLAQPFMRLGAERTGSENGQGLGLSIVAAVAAAHSGTLQLHARPDGGLRVQVTLPSAAVTQHTSMP